MSNKKRVAALFIPAMVAVAFSSTAFAQGMTSGAMSSGKMTGQRTKKVLDENEKMRATDNVYRPGDTSPSSLRLGQFTYFLQGGTLERTFADGSKVVVKYKTGDHFLNKETRPHSVKNIGTTTVHNINVALQ